MVLDQLVLAATLSFAQPSHAPSYDAYVPQSGIAMRYIDTFGPPAEFEFRDAPPAARTDELMLERPATRYRRR